MLNYQLLDKKGEGTFSEVFKALSKKFNKLVAIKCMKNHYDSVEQVLNMHEIQALRKLASHPNIIKLIEVLYDEPTGRLALVFELMEMNLFELIENRQAYLPESQIKFYIYQALNALAFMHKNGIFHRDIKPENFLISENKLKIADFGSCKSTNSITPYTEYVATRWYRPPESLLTKGFYNEKMDLWGIGCVLYEITTLNPLFPGSNRYDQIHKIHNILGTPSKDLLLKFKKFNQKENFLFAPKSGIGIENTMNDCSTELINLLKKLLEYDPEKRISAKNALRHPFFKDFNEAENRIKNNILNRSNRALLNYETTKHLSTNNDLTTASENISVKQPHKKEERILIPELIKIDDQAIHQRKSNYYNNIGSQDTKNVIHFPNIIDESLEKNYSNKAFFPPLNFKPYEISLKGKNNSKKSQKNILNLIEDVTPHYFLSPKIKLSHKGKFL